jgi:glyoxylase-like metal-dependent hydrolase (beta-lactamase superfamily II)
LLDLGAAAPHIPSTMDIPAKPWPTGLSEQCEPLVRRVLAPNASPYTFTGTQTYIVGAGAEVAVIDPGPADFGAGGEPSPFKGADTNGAGHVDAILAAVGGARISAILCTHTHRDHSPAAAPLKARTGAPIIGCAPLVLSDDGPRADSAFDHSYAPDRVLRDGEQISGPDWTIAAVATPGHTSNHLCYAVLESGALFTGDHVSPPDGDMAAYMASLQKLYERGDKVLYPAHGPAITKPRQLVRGMLGHRRQREAQILRLLDLGPHRIADMVSKMYKGLDPRLTGAAGRSVLAHLIDLAGRGTVRIEGELWSRG